MDLSGASGSRDGSCGGRPPQVTARRAPGFPHSFCPKLLKENLFTGFSRALSVPNFLRVALGEPNPFPATFSPPFVDGIAAPEVRNWPTFRAFAVSPFRPRPT